MSLDYTRLLEIHEKKSECFMAGTIKILPNEDFDSNVGEVDGSATKNYYLGNFPKDAIITAAYLYVQVVADGIAPIVDLGTAENSDDLVAAGDIKASTGGVAGVVLVAGDYISTGSGLELWMKLTPTNSTEGTFIFVVEYMEYKLNTGNLTRITQRIA